MLESRRIHLPGLELVSELGSGAYSTVYRARHAMGDVAVKIYRLDRDLDSAHRRFAREAATLARLDHPGLTRVYDIDEADGRPYIVREFIDGETLARLLHRGPLSRNTAVSIAAGLAEILAVVHDHGLTHRDIKPSNILIDRDGRPHLIDFGFVGYGRGSEESEHSIGTVQYSSPEQCGMLNRPVDGRSDLYALGVVLFEGVTSHLPFEAEDVGELIHKHASVPAPSVSVIRPDLGPALGAIIEKLLAKDPDDRYQSGWQLLADLQRLDELDRTSRPATQLARSEGPNRRWNRSFVGRAHELQCLRNAYDRVLSGGTHAIIVTGDTGIGRSELLSAFTRHVESSEGILLKTICSPAHVVPFSDLRNAFAELAHRVRSGRVSASTKASLRALIARQGPWLRRFAPSLVTSLGTGIALAAEPGQSGFQRRVLEFLAELARVEGRLTITLDDAQWLDAETRNLLEQLAQIARSAPILLVFVVRVDENPAAGAEFIKDFGGLRCEQLELQPLHPAAIAELIQCELRGLDVPRDLIDVITLRSGGNPLILREHVQAMIHAGLLRPSWGRWRVDTAELDRLVLPTGVEELLVGRLSGLSNGCRDFMTTAALVGTTFELAIVGLAHQVPDAPRLLEEAKASQIIESVGADEYRFVHEGMRTALLESLSETARVERHGAIADALAMDDMERPDRLYALAHHAYASVDDRTIRRTFRACVAGAKAALADRATVQAQTLIDRALEMAARGAFEIPPDVHVTAAAIAIATGNVTDAGNWARKALSSIGDPIERAHVHAYLAEAHLINFHAPTAWTEVNAGFDQIGVRHHHAVVRIVEAAAALTWDWINRVFRRRRKTVTDPSMQRKLRAAARLYELGGLAAYVDMQPWRLGELGLLAVANAERLGPSPELSRAYSGYGVILAALGRRSASQYYLDQARDVAKFLHDPALSAHCDVYGATALHLLGSVVEAAHVMSKCLTHQERKMDAMDFYNGAADLSFNLFARGYFQDAWEWVDRGTRKMVTNDRSGFVYAPIVDVSAFAALGRPAEAAQALERSLSVLSSLPTDRFRWSILLGHRLLYHLEQDEIGEPIDEIIEIFGDLKMVPHQAIIYSRIFYVTQLYARMAQTRSSLGRQRDHCLQRLEQAVSQLESAANFSPLLGHLCVGRAAVATYTGDLDSAHHWLANAQRLSDRLDSPWVTFEVEWLRAEILELEGNPTGAQQHARLAYAIATQQGWVPRARRVRARFTLDLTGRRWATVHPSSGSGATRDLRMRRQLDALLEISVASTSVLDPQAYAESVLREVVRILGAERSFLLVRDGDDGRLQLVAGCGAQGESLLLERSYSAHVVDEVVRTKSAIISDGQQTDATLGGSFGGRELRSIIAAPLMVREELKGVIYLDSRLARGLFTEDDTEILQGIANHIAIALETARTARVEARFEAERRQRELAEAMRALSHRLSSTLRLEDVVEGLLRHVHSIVPYDAGGVALLELDELVLYDTFETGGVTPITTQVVSSLFDRLAHRETAMIVEPGSLDPAESDAFDAHSWLAIPLSRHGQVMGLLALRSPALQTFSQRELEVASALAGQAMTAIQNARLFEEVQRLATTDGLTGAYNRRHLFERGIQEFERSRRYERPLSAIILDLDHFKQVNDRHGHAVGDRLLRAVADICLRSIRACDILGRYGGEEFVIILPDTDAEEAGTLAERLRLRLGQFELATGEHAISITASLGVTEIAPEDADFDTMLDRSDRALYAAKTAGRDAVFATTGVGLPERWRSETPSDDSSQILEGLPI